MVKKKIYDFLIYLQRHTGMDIFYFAKSGFWMSLFNIAQILLSMIVSVCLARFLLPSDYGAYKFILSIFGVVAIFSLPGMNTAMAQSISRGFDSSFKKGIKERFKYSFLGSVALIFVTLYLYKTLPSNFWVYFIFLSIIFPFFYSFEFNSYFIGKEKFKLLAKYSIIKLSVYSGSVLIALFLFKNLFWILFAHIFSISLICFLVSYKQIKKVKGEKQDKDVIPYGKKLTLINIIPLVSGQIDKIMLPYFLGLEGLAIYSVALLVPEGIKNSLKSFIGIAFPRLTKVETKTGLKLIRKNLFPVLVILISYIILGWFLLPYFIKYLIGGIYLESISYAQILLLYIPFALFSLLFCNFLLAKKKNKQIFYYNLLSSSLRIILFVVLIPLFGVWGAVIGKILAEGFSMILGYLLNLN